MKLDCFNLQFEQDSCLRRLRSHDREVAKQHCDGELIVNCCCDEEMMTGTQQHIQKMMSADQKSNKKIVVKL